MEDGMVIFKVIVPFISILDYLIKLFFAIYLIYLTKDIAFYYFFLSNISSHFYPFSYYHLLIGFRKKPYYLIIYLFFRSLHICHIKSFDPINFNLIVLSVKGYLLNNKLIHCHFIFIFYLKGSFILLYLLLFNFLDNFITLYVPYFFYYYFLFSHFLRLFSLVCCPLVDIYLITNCCVRSICHF